MDPVARDGDGFGKRVRLGRQRKNKQGGGKQASEKRHGEGKAGRAMSNFF
jgi:hypothetical protein